MNLSSPDMYHFGVHVIKYFKNRRPLFYTDSIMFIDKYYYGKLYIEHVMI